MRILLLAFDFFVVFSPSSAIGVDSADTSCGSVGVFDALGAPVDGVVPPFPLPNWLVSPVGSSSVILEDALVPKRDIRLLPLTALFALAGFWYRGWAGQSLAAWPWCS